MAQTSLPQIIERVIREYFLKPFQVAVQQGGIESVMASYNEIDGIPSHSNEHLLDDILRHEWGFPGILVSDYFGITDLNTLHHVVASYDERAPNWRSNPVWILNCPPLTPIAASSIK